ncbi:MAG: hypothetical protein QG567_7, partial [Campylobacterota bacterium]|nr:hypothetical protein [Campylobacterota bacterium]
MQICFMANYKTTFFFNELAKKLEIDGYTVFWTTVNNSLYNYLCSKYPKERVLLINKECIAEKNIQIGEFKINELIFQDRSLKHQQEWASEYLMAIQKPIYSFIASNQIHLVLGELTWAHEILTHRICSSFKELNCIYLKMHTIRMPYERFAFFCDEFESKIYAPLDNAIDNNYKLLLKKPTYQILLEKKDKSSKKEKKATLYNKYTKIIGDDNDPTIIVNKFERFKIHKKIKLNKFTYKYIKKIPLKELEGKNFCFMPLHKQPESSIDGNGRYYEDQFTNAINIWRLLPNGWILAIKEHKTAIGDRSYFFYKKLQSF